MTRSMGGWLAAATLTCALAAPPPANACMHVIELTKEDAIAGVARAERLLANGRPVVAYRLARRSRQRLERHIRQEGSAPATVALVERARSITALAVVRLDGRTPISARTARRHVVRGRAQRSLAWAHEQLASRAAAAPDDLRAQAHLAEALARIPDRRHVARRILSGLAERDLMPSSHGYAALLRLVRPGTDEWQRSLTRCRRMAADHADRICPAARSSSSRSAGNPASSVAPGS